MMMMNCLKQVMFREAPRLARRTQRTIFTSTSFLLEKQTMKVPSMGDSITEGTIVEWATAVGQAVKEGDVIALVETDKVTVDIKAEIDGVVTQQFGAIDETVEVGADLYEIDTEAAATVTASTESAPAAAPAAAPAEEVKVASKEAAPVAAPKTSVPPSSDVGRKSLIHFLGKDGWKRRLSGADEPISLIPDTPTGVVVLDGSMLTSSYGRPGFSEEEMEALMSGGANMAPSVVATSGGAMFSSK
mmetsp:Transcript_22470/g.37175  ORF Transcript_22470/g.37175 Transcript_22470/m.37175 type:complete len:245 (+) Transcript_22470:61-795(+)|eukprot:CAMPEP_0119006968 /NCGR_PEP_ID=MMETSP1176-20130426/2672_1 /TAXON_ID=265551 /ORGANISM="Synedropsis recta cf, Strain CCMP1620" /LENGTH=244 /DNA_ID=CAMNT_0006959011 /DNA_START=61 /DNA_END=795 /DNA_ORIENTATION=-